MIKKYRGRSEEDIHWCTCKFPVSLYFVLNEGKVGLWEGNWLTLIKSDLMKRTHGLADRISIHCWAESIRLCVVKECVKNLALKESELIYGLVWFPATRFECKWFYFSLWAVWHTTDTYVIFCCIFIILLTLAFLFLCIHQRSHSIR